jgi:signal transduction histidine kinase
MSSATPHDLQATSPTDIVAKPARRMLIRYGKILGAALFVAAIIGLVSVAVRETQRPLKNPELAPQSLLSASTQYRDALQALQTAVIASAAKTDPMGRPSDLAEILTVVQARYAAVNSASHLANTPTRSGATTVLAEHATYHAQLGTLVRQAVASPAGLAEFDQLSQLRRTEIATLVDELRAAETAAIKLALGQQQTSTNIAQELTLFLLAMLGAGIFFHVKSAQKERCALIQESEARSEAQRSVQARTALLGMVSHELRTPLQTITANTELLSLLPDQDRFADTLQRIQRSVELIAGQLDNIARYTRLASGNEQYQRERFSIADVLRRVVEEHSSSALANQQQLVLSIEPTVEGTVQSEPVRLHQVVNNFIGNAVKYSGPGRIVTSARIVRHEFGDGPGVDAVEIQVTDSGPGIPDAELSSIWEPFVRGRSSSSRFRGSGLGLAVVKLLSNSAGWVVGVRSEQGNGACFFLLLPLPGGMQQGSLQTAAPQAPTSNC